MFPFENSKMYNVNTNHPLIPNSDQILYYRKYVSIHSEDRDPLKYPISTEFEIELPEDLLNVLSIKLNDWTFPANYNTFSKSNNNVSMSFVINNPYNPTPYIISNLQYAIYECLFYTTNDEYFIFTEQIYSIILKVLFNYNIK